MDNLKAQLNAALERREFELYLQPQIELRTGTVVGAEALVRWNHPTGLMQPDEFIPALERRGAVVELDFFMLEEVCTLLVQWRKQGRRAVSISVNQSQIHFWRRDYLDRVETVFRQWNVDPHELVFEFTETVLCQDSPLISHTAQRLRELGVRLAIDDFGTGYSSLARLKNTVVDQVKLDKGFLESSGHESRDCILLGKTLELIQALGAQSLCEGIERLDQERLLRELGCDLAQGYLYAKPMTVAAFALRYIEPEELPMLARM